MKTILGITLIALGIIAGIYCGIWWAFIGGIVAVVDAIRAPNLEALGLACGIVRIFFAGGIGWLAALALIFPGAALYAAGSDSK